MASSCVLIHGGMFPNASLATPVQDVVQDILIPACSRPEMIDCASIVTWERAQCLACLCQGRGISSSIQFCDNHIEFNTAPSTIMFELPRAKRYFS